MMTRAILLAIGLAGAMSASLSCTATPNDTPRDTPKEPVKTAPITEISLQQTTNGWGAGPAYTLTLRANGTASFDGNHNATRQGRWKGTIAKAEFTRLAQELRDSGFPDYKPPSVPVPTDQARTIVSALSGGKRESAIDEAQTAGPELTGVIQTLSAEIGRIEWKKDVVVKQATKTGH